MSEPKKEKKYLNLGTMMQAKKRDPNNPDEPKRFYIKMEQQKGKDKQPYGEQIFPITLANGQVINDGDIVSMYSKKEKFKKSVDEGHMTQDKADELSKFLLFDIVLVAEVDPKKSGDDGPNF